MRQVKESLHELLPPSGDSPFIGGRQAPDLTRLADVGLEEALDDARVETFDSAPIREDDAAEVGRERCFGSCSFKLSRKLSTAKAEATFGSRPLELFRLLADIEVSGNFQRFAK